MNNMGVIKAFVNLDPNSEKMIKSVSLPLTIQKVLAIPVPASNQWTAVYNVSKSRLKYISFAAHYIGLNKARVADGGGDLVANAYVPLADASADGWKYYNYTPICPIQFM